MNQKRDLNWIGAVVALIAAVCGFVLEHIAALQLPPHIIPLFQLVVLAIVALTGWLQKKYALPTDYKFAALLAAIPDDGIEQFITYLNAARAAKQKASMLSATEERKRKADAIIEQAKRDASAALRGEPTGATA